MFADISAKSFLIYKIRFASCCYGYDYQFEPHHVKFEADVAEI